jgi:hypothetical protein
LFIGKAFNWTKNGKIIVAVVIVTFSSLELNRFPSTLKVLELGSNLIFTSRTERESFENLCFCPILLFWEKNGLTGKDFGIKPNDINKKTPKIALFT